MSCCKCNLSGRCRNCSCIKSGRTCQGCLPQRLGHCTNVTLPLQCSSPETSTASIADETVAMPPDDVLSQSSDEDEVSRAKIDVTWPSPALQPPNLRGAPVVVKSFARKSTWPTRKWSTGDEIFFKCHQDLQGKPLFQNWPPSFKPMRTAQVWNA